MEEDYQKMYELSKNWFTAQEYSVQLNAFFEFKIEKHKKNIYECHPG